MNTDPPEPLTYAAAPDPDAVNADATFDAGWLLIGGGVLLALMAIGLAVYALLFGWHLP